MLEPLTRAYDPKVIQGFFEQFPNYASERLNDSGRGFPLRQIAVSDATKHRGEIRRLAEELLKHNERGAVFVLHDSQGNYRLGHLEFIYRGKNRPRATASSLLILKGRPNKTARQRLGLLQNLADEEKPLTLEELRKALSVEAVNEEFYKGFVKVFENTLVPAVKGLDQAVTRDFLLAFVARTFFVSFVAKRGWLGPENFLPWLLSRYQQTRQDGFYTHWLKPLFFQSLKGPPQSKGADFAHLPEDVRAIYQAAPYLNGELFKPKSGLDLEGVFITDEAIQAFFNFLFAYNFTVEENDAYEVDLELNPEFLGLILERLINSVGVEGKASEIGAHYTPRIEVDLMCRLSLAELLYRRGLPYEKAYDLMNGGVEGLTPEEQKKAREVLLTARALDPAVGSGAFPVGLLQVLEETLDLLGEPRTLDRKKRLLQNLHGVDILPWAVWMAELRLWLAYFLELPDHMKDSKEPLLPSLGLKIMQGDSVGQAAGTRPIPTRLEADPALLKDPQVQQHLQKMVQAKEDYFHNRGASVEQVKELEKEFLLRLLDRKYGNGQPGLLVQSQSDRYQEERKLLEEALTEERPFLYLVDFAEVLVGEGGFDLVIGNPPYVRQEEIRDVLGRFSAKAYKDMLAEQAKADLSQYPPYNRKATLDKPAGRSDLYIYFYARTLALLKPDGVHTFIVSNSWLDVQYGAWLQQVFLKAAPLRYVIENRLQRSFQADVNTVITLAWAPGQEVRPDWPVYFVAVKTPFEEAGLLEAFQKTRPPEEVKA